MSHFLLHHMTYCAAIGRVVLINRIFFDFVGRVVITEYRDRIFFDFIGWVVITEYRDQIFFDFVGRVLYNGKSGILFIIYGATSVSEECRSALRIID